MENIRKNYEKELRTLEISDEEELTVKLVTKKFNIKALKVHSDKTHTDDDEEFKELLNHYNKLKEAIAEVSKEENNDEEQSDLQSFFEKHNFAREFSQSWTIFVEKEKVNDWKNIMSSLYPDYKNTQGNGTQFKTQVEERIVFTTLYDVEVPKMNIQGNHNCIRKFVLNILPELYSKVRNIPSLLQSEKTKKVPINAKVKLSGETVFSCEVCPKTYIRKAAIKKHIQMKHGRQMPPEQVSIAPPIPMGCVETAKPSESIVIEEIDDDNKEPSESIEIEEIDDDTVEGIVEERRCPTPLPENIFICAECSRGFETQREVEHHMNYFHSQVSVEDRLRRLEAELAYEKSQHSDHLESLESTLREVESHKQTICELENLSRTKDKEIEDLRREIESKEKENKKSTEKLNEEVNNLKKQNLQTSEALRLAVLERENLRENDRILLNTLDMMKIYVESIKNKEGVLDNKIFKCDKCPLTFTSVKHLQEHKKNKHSVVYNDVLQREEEETEKAEIIYTCNKCNFVTKEENDLTGHTKSSHDSFECDLCSNKYELESNLQEHKNKDHVVTHCEFCSYRSGSSSKMNEHVRSTHVNNRRRDIPCIYWNHGYCKYFEMCKFSHVEIPACPLQENCNEYKCPLYHSNKTFNNFLGRNLRKAIRNQ